MLKRKPEIHSNSDKNPFKSMGCLLKFNSRVHADYRSKGSVTNGRMQEITGEHSKDITVVLQSLVRDGLLTQQNQRRWASYRVAGDSPHNGVDSPRRDPLLWSIGEPARAKERLAPETMMVRELLLELRHPGVPNRPDQAYRRLKK